MSLELLSTLIGALVPALVSVVVRSSWPSWVKGLIALGSSGVIGFLTVLLKGELTGVNLVTAVVIVFAASQIAYATWWKTTGIGPAIEKSTDPSNVK